MTRVLYQTKKTAFDAILITFIGCYFLLQSINLLFKVAIGEPQWWHLLSRLFLAVLLAMAVFVIVSRNVGALLAEGVAIILLLITLLLGTISKEYPELESTIFNFYLVYIPLGLALYSVKDMKRALRILYRFAWISEIILFITIFISRSSDLFVSSETGDGSYNMAIGYSMLFNSLIIFDHFVSKKRVVDLLVVLASIILTILFSSRTPLLCFGAFALLRIFKSKTIKKKTKKMVFVLLILALVAIIIFYSAFAKQLYYYLSNKGYESTSLRKLLLDPLDDSHRSVIYSTYISQALQRPVIGHGLLGGWTLGTYPHNIFIDVFLSYGFFAGTIVIVSGLVLLYKGINCKDQALFRLVCILCAYNFHLLISSSYLRSVTFCMLVAVCIKSTQKTRKVINSVESITLGQDRYNNKARFNV